MSWGAFVLIVLGFAAVGLLLVGLIGFAWSDIVTGPDPEWDE